MANPYMPLFVGDYLKDTGELSNEEHGIYLKLLMFMWSQGGFLRNDPRVLCRLTGVSYRRWAPIWANLERYFYVEGDTLRHTKVEKTLRKAREISEKRKAASAKKYAKKGNENNKTRPAIVGGSDMQMDVIQSKGLDSSLREENPILTAQHEMKHVTASPPSPMEGGGDATDGEHIRALNRWLQGRIHGLMVSNVLTGRDVRQLKEAVRGGSEECLWLAPKYKPPDHVAAALESVAIDWKHLPQLKAIGGTHFDPH